jgi:3-hydroxyacyl-[acyl-carrier-protein] dehydratase
MRLEYFQMVDRITRLDTEAREIVAECLVPDESPVFEGHFPGHPILPGALMIETIAQTGGWLVLATLRFAAMPFLAQVKQAKMRSFVPPGEALVAQAELQHDGSGYAVVSGRLHAGGKVAAEADITYRVVPFPNETLRAQMLATARRIAVPEAFFDAA